MTRVVPFSLLAAALAFGCATPQEHSATITGTVTYLQRIAMPPNAVVEVTLVDLTGQPKRPVTIAQQRIPNPGQVPVPFTLAYDPRLLQPGHQYAVHAQILVDGKPWFISRTANHHVVGGRIVRADLVLQPVEVR